MTDNVDSPGQGAAEAVPLTVDQQRQLNRLTTIARLVAGLAHELNNSLQVISGLVELLAERDDLPHDAALRIQKIGGQADRATAVIRQVLAHVRDAGGGAGPVDLAPVVERALSLRQYQLGRAGVTSQFDRVPEERCVVWGDERQLQQVVINLLVNAEEALAGEPQRLLRLSLSRGGGLVRLAVADTGGGVPPGLRQRIFDPFFTTRASERAVGLGLTVGAAIAATHGGRLRLAEEGPGATFVLELPEHRGR